MATMYLPRRFISRDNDLYTLIYNDIHTVTIIIYAYFIWNNSRLLGDACGTSMKRTHELRACATLPSTPSTHVRDQRVADLHLLSRVLHAPLTRTFDVNCTWTIKKKMITQQRERRSHQSLCSFSCHWNPLDAFTTRLSRWTGSKNNPHDALADGRCRDKCRGSLTYPNDIWGIKNRWWNAAVGRYQHNKAGWCHIYSPFMTFVTSFVDEPTQQFYAQAQRNKVTSLIAICCQRWTVRRHLGWECFAVSQSLAIDIHSWVKLCFLMFSPLFLLPFSMPN